LPKPTTDKSRNCNENTTVEKILLVHASLWEISTVASYPRQYNGSVQQVLYLFRLGTFQVWAAVRCLFSLRSTLHTTAI